MAENYKAYPAAGTPLFETVLRGVGDMKQRYQPGAVNDPGDLVSAMAKIFLAAHAPR